MTDLVGVGRRRTSVGSLSFAYYRERGGGTKWIIEPGETAEQVLAEAVRRDERSAFLAGGPRSLESRLVRLGLPWREATELAESLWRRM
jgi:hypothetical protein